MIKENLQKNKACPAKFQRSRGFVLLFAVTLSAILLAMALGVSNIAYKELVFSSSARDADNAFFAADTGAECALRYDRSDNNAFGGSVSTISCADNNNISPGGGDGLWTFSLSGLGNDQKSCAVVKVEKNSSTNKTTVTSRGYNRQGSTGCGQDRGALERELEVTYATVTPSSGGSPTETYTLTINSVNPISGVTMTITPSGTGGGNSTPYTRTYDSGTPVSVTAPSTASIGPFGYTSFNSWTWANGTAGCGGSTSGSSTDRTCSNIPMSGNKTITANYQ